ncbi:MAG: crossover junction endodeoxyribonuclease RuvC [Gammaproteobacteria bacterium]|nr:crossover junction endodeoxyribonuclease RuvC [Gammaproteobacteria bacterium]
MTIVLGIDPGSRMTGFGVVELRNKELHHITHGVLRLGNRPMPVRLRDIFTGVRELIDEHDVDRFAIETSYVGNNPQTAIKLGQARGVAIAAAAMCDLPVAEYSPREIKKTTVGTGNAAKDQVQFMVKTLLGLANEPAHDSADALAVAICDLNASRFSYAADQTIHTP